jgi:processive 1,2-diacylglycerol beta-glucosyltransferase
MDELMAVSDLLITKPGGLTASEALALGKPLLILNPIPGQEAANSDFLLERGAASKINRVEDLPFRIEQLLGSKKLAGMARAAAALGRPAAAADICRAVNARLDARPPASCAPKPCKTDRG